MEQQKILYDHSIIIVSKNAVPVKTVKKNNRNPYRRLSDRRILRSNKRKKEDMK